MGLIRWEESKRRQDWYRGVASRGCPCPVCNVPVNEFIKLFLTGDSSENETLRKELKLVKRRLAKERAELEKTRQELISLSRTEQEETQPAGRTRQMSASSRMTLEKDLQDLCAAAALLLCDSPPSKPKSTTKPTRSREARPSYQRHESCPLQNSSSFPESGRNFDMDPPSIPNSVSMPPAPRSSRRSSRRRLEERRGESPRRRVNDIADSRSSPNRTASSRHRGCPTPESRRSNSSPSVVVIRPPDPPTPPPPPPPRSPSTPVRSNPADDSGSNSSISSLSGIQLFTSSRADFDDPPSCRSPGADSIAGNAPTPTRRSPFINFMGASVDPPSGLLGGCIYID